MIEVDFFAWAKFSAMRLARFLTCDIFVSLRGDLLECWCFYLIFFNKVPSYFFWLVLEFIFEVKVLQEDFMASLMVHWVLYLLRFSDVGFVLNFLWVAWRSFIISLHLSVKVSWRHIAVGFSSAIKRSSSLWFGL